MCGYVGEKKKLRHNKCSVVTILTARCTHRPKHTALLTPTGGTLPSEESLSFVHTPAFPHKTENTLIYCGPSASLSFLWISGDSVTPAECDLQAGPSQVEEHHLLSVRSSPPVLLFQLMHGSMLQIFMASRAERF